MNKLKYILLFLIINQSCSGQSEAKNVIIGNWQIVKHDVHGTVYQEIYVDSTFMYYYDINIGINPKSKYYLEDNVLSHSQLGSDIEELGEIMIVDDETFSITYNGEKVSYKRLSGENLLGDLVNSKISEQEYSMSFFGRFEKWE